MKKMLLLFLFMLFINLNLFAQDSNESTKSEMLAGGFGSLGYGFLTGNVSEYINNPILLPITGDFVYNNFVAQINLDAGYSTVAKTMEFSDGSSWNKGDNVFHDMYGLNVGYSVFNNSNLRITPLVGYGSNFLSKKWWAKSDIAAHEPRTYNMNITLLVDFKNAFSPDRKGNDYFGLRVSFGAYIPTGDASVYPEFYNGTTIYLSVGVISLTNIN